MAFKCELCDKGAIRAANRSHSKTKTLRRQKPNLQKMDGKKVCTRCIRTASKVATKKSKTTEATA
jgi:ribosomal protein L28